MLGAIIGDIVGSRFEFNNTDNKDFEFFHRDCKVTDDSVMTVAVMESMLDGHFDDEQQFKADVIRNFKTFYKEFPDGGYGPGFKQWLNSDNPQPYESFGNGACMRISPVSILLGEARVNATRWATEVSHNHPLALAWAEYLTTAIARVKGLSVEAGKEYLKSSLAQTYSEENRFKYYLNGIAEVCPGEFDESCQGVMPIAVKAVLDAEDFEDAIRNAVAYGGDSDTIACIAGALAEALFGITAGTRRAVQAFLPAGLSNTISRFYSKFA